MEQNIYVLFYSFFNFDNHLIYYNNFQIKLVVNIFYVCSNNFIFFGKKRMKKGENSTKEITNYTNYKPVKSLQQ